MPVMNLNFLGYERVVEDFQKGTFSVDIRHRIDCCGNFRKTLAIVLIIMGFLTLIAWFIS